MNIIWTIETALETACKTKTIQVSQSDIWSDIKLSEPNLRRFRSVETVDIIKDGKTFRNIPSNWYMIQN